MIETSPDFLSRLAAYAASWPGGELAFTLVLFILVLSVLVFVHELGHYMAARQVGVKVQAFAIGFGRPLLSWSDKHGTEWRVGWIPLGGYVQLLGQTDLVASRQSQAKGHYMSKSVLQRAWIILAGPLANVVLGMVVLWAAFLGGEQRLKAEVGGFVPDMPAAQVLQVGDVITKLNETAVVAWDDVPKLLDAQTGEPVTLDVLRGGQALQVSITPSLTDTTDVFGQPHRAVRLGITPSGATFEVEHSFIGAGKRAAERTAELTSLTVQALWKLITGAMGAENLTGPLGIADLTGQTAQTGLYALLMLMAVVSINLFVVNLFPLPVLDGGHLVMLAYEAVRGKPLGERVQEWAFRVGLGCILCLVLLSTYQDVRRFGWVEKPAASASTQP